MADLFGCPTFQIGKNLSHFFKKNERESLSFVNIVFVHEEESGLKKLHE